MQAETLVLDSDGSLDCRTVQLPELTDDQLRLRVELSGVCGSDVHMWQHEMELPFPLVPGHEFVGVIEAIGGGTWLDSARRPLSEGDALTVVPGISCGDCWYCDMLPTRPLACNDRDIYGFRSVEEPPYAHGGMSQYFILDREAHFYRLPDSLPTELGALVEPLAVATHAVDRAMAPGLPNAREGLGFGQSVVVQGAGPIGLLTIGAVSAAGAGEVIAVDRLPERLRMAERFGATETINLDDYEGTSFIDEIEALTPSGEGPDVTFEAVGHPKAFEQALQIPHNAGTVIEIGHYFSAGEAAVDPSELIHRELDIRGSLAYPPAQFDTSISLLERTRDRFPYEALLNHRVGLDEATDAFETQASGGAYRASVHPWE